MPDTSKAPPSTLLLCTDETFGNFSLVENENGTYSVTGNKAALINWLHSAALALRAMGMCVKLNDETNKGIKIMENHKTEDLIDAYIFRELSTQHFKTTSEVRVDLKIREKLLQITGGKYGNFSLIKKDENEFLLCGNERDLMAFIIDALLALCQVMSSDSCPETQPE